jgi:D-alanine-D-alanine ligase
VEFSSLAAVAGEVKVFRELYRERRDAMLESRADLMPADCRWTRPGGGFYVWLQLPPGVNSKAMLPRAMSSRVAYVPGTGFYADGSGGDHLRLSYCFPEPDRIREGVRRLAEVVGAELDLLSTFRCGPAPMSDLGHVLVLAGGLSPEREVSLRSGDRLRDALQEAGVDATMADADSALIPSIMADPPDVVFRAIHGACGEDGSMREALALLGVPYVGSTANASRFAFDKPTAKAVVRSAGLRTPESVTLPRETFHDLEASAVLERIVATLGLPLFVKPARGGSALGAARVRSAEELPGAMIGCFACGDTALVERCVTGTEVAVGVFDLGRGPEALPAVEIRPVGDAFDYAARYTTGQTEFYAPARLPADVAADVAAAHNVLGLRDLSRTDLIVSGDQVFFLEVNVAPGMTETSTLPMAFQAAGLDLGVACRDLLCLAAARGS